MNKKKRIIIMLKLSMCNSGIKKSMIVKKAKIFAEYGENNYWFPRILPAEPELVTIHNNVHIASDVYFCTHDVMHRMFNNMPECVELLPINSRGGGINIRLVK